MPLFESTSASAKKTLLATLSPKPSTVPALPFSTEKIEVGKTDSCFKHHCETKKKRAKDAIQSITDSQITDRIIEELNKFNYTDLMDSKNDNIPIQDLARRNANIPIENLAPFVNAIQTLNKDQKAKIISHCVEYCLHDYALRQEVQFDGDEEKLSEEANKLKSALGSGQKDSGTSVFVSRLLAHIKAGINSCNKPTEVIASLGTKFEQELNKEALELAEMPKEAVKLTKELVTKKKELSQAVTERLADRKQMIGAGDSAVAKVTEVINRDRKDSKRPRFGLQTLHGELTQLRTGHIIKTEEKKGETPTPDVDPTTAKRLVNWEELRAAKKACDKHLAYMKKQKSGKAPQYIKDDVAAYQQFIDERRTIIEDKMISLADEAKEPEYHYAKLGIEKDRLERELKDLKRQAKAKVKEDRAKLPLFQRLKSIRSTSVSPIDQEAIEQKKKAIEAKEQEMKSLINNPQNKNRDIKNCLPVEEKAKLLVSKARAVVDDVATYQLALDGIAFAEARAKPDDAKSEVSTPITTTLCGFNTFEIGKVKNDGREKKLADLKKEIEDTKNPSPDVIKKLEKACTDSGALTQLTPRYGQQLTPGVNGNWGAHSPVLPGNEKSLGTIDQLLAINFPANLYEQDHKRPSTKTPYGANSPLLLERDLVRRFQVIQTEISSLKDLASANPTMAMALNPVWLKLRKEAKEVGKELLDHNNLYSDHPDITAHGGEARAKFFREELEKLKQWLEGNRLSIKLKQPASRDHATAAEMLGQTVSIKISSEFMRNHVKRQQGGAALLKDFIDEKTRTLRCKGETPGVNPDIKLEDVLDVLAEWRRTRKLEETNRGIVSPVYGLGGLDKKTIVGYVIDFQSDDSGRLFKEDFLKFMHEQSADIIKRNKLANPIVGGDVDHNQGMGADGKAVPSPRQ